MVEIKWSSQAQRDLSSIAEFIAKDSKKYARITLKRIVEKTDVLKSDPKSGRIVPEVGIDSIRELIFSHYRIVYHIRTDAIFIVTVHHSAMLFNPGKVR
jgi:addiction module RelE/StbE family toxin